MKKLNVSQVENLQGSGNDQAVLCGIGVGLLFTPSWRIGAAVFALACLKQDSGR